MAAHLEAPCRVSIDLRLKEEREELADKYAPEFNPYDREDIAAVVPCDLVDPVQQILECEGSTVECYEEARKKLEIALGRRWSEL